MSLKGKTALFDWEVFPEWNCKAWGEYDGNSSFNQMHVITPDTVEDAMAINEILKNMNCAGLIDLKFSELEPMQRYRKQLKFVRDTYDCSGYNIIQYDLPIDNAACQGYTPKDLYILNNKIITDKDFKDFSYWRNYTFTDLISDLKMGSLKQYESNKGLDIRETTVPFGTVNLTIQQKAEIIFYCCHDLFASGFLMKDRKGYLNAKLMCSKISSVTEDECWRNTSAKLAAKVMLAKKKDSTSIPVYEIPERLKNIIYESLHPTIIDNFEQTPISNDWSYECRYIKNTINFGTGGIHSTYKDALVCKSTATHVLLNADFENLYPSLMIEFGYYPEGVPEKGRELFRHMLKRCRELKAQLRKMSKDDPAYKNLYNERDALKLVLNASTGAMRSKYSPLFDPTQIIKLCMTGQLLTLLVAKKLHDLGGLILQTNTDGVMFYIERNKLEDVQNELKNIFEICNIPIELDEANSVFQKDVNNYILVDTKGRCKLKGRWAKKSGEDTPLSPLFAPVINNSVIEYYTKGTNIESYIRNHDVMLDFCMTTMKGPTYDGVVYELNGESFETTKINRVYATTDNRYGTLYKVKLDNDSPEELKRDKIASIPDNARIHNEEVKSIRDDLDYEWYIKAAKKNLIDMEDITIYA